MVNLVLDLRRIGAGCRATALGTKGMPAKHVVPHLRRIVEHSSLGPCDDRLE